MVAVGLVLFAVALFTSGRASGGPFGSWSAGQRAAGLAFVVVCLLWFLAVLVRRGSRPLWLAAEAGGVLLQPQAVEDPLRDALSEHADVVRAHVSVSGRRGRLKADVRVAVRPYAEATALRDELSAKAQNLLGRLTGGAVDKVSLRVRVLTVRELGRYL